MCASRPVGAGVALRHFFLTSASSFLFSLPSTLFFCSSCRFLLDCWGVSGFPVFLLVPFLPDHEPLFRVASRPPMARPACLLWRPPRRGLFSSLPLLLTVCFCSFVLVIWYGMNTDREYIHPLLNQLIPAGHCACQSATIFECSSCMSCVQSGGLLQQQQPPASSSNWRFRYEIDAGNEALDRNQCKTGFPGLFEDVDRAVKYWQLRGAPLNSADLDDIYLEYGMARAWISGGELYVMATRARNEDHRRKILAVLSAIHRALVADGERRSRDIEFVFSVEDKVEDVTGPERPVWVFSRTALEEAVWLMPDFGYWAWDNQQNPIGPYDQVVEQIQRSEVPWAEKLPQLVWRGKPSFAPKLRRALLEAARGKPWGDVKQVDWYGRTNILRMEDHCKYMFIAHVEGMSTSLFLYRF